MFCFQTDTFDKVCVEFKNGSWVLRFPSHPRCEYWAYSMLLRKRLLSQGNFYIKHNLGEHLPSVDKLCEMLRSSSYTNLMRKIQYYAKHICGTKSYWYQIKEQLKATMHQIGTPTILWTLSCAEFHWTEFYTLFGDVSNGYNTYKNNVINDRHILDWFCTERTESFVTHCFYNTLGAKWHWYRFEHVMHFHELAKLKDDPGLCDLASKAVSVKQLSLKQLTKEKYNSSRQSILNELDSTVINDGVSAEKIVFDCYHKLITCINPAEVDSWVKPSVRACQKKIDEAIISSEDDYTN